MSMQFSSTTSKIDDWQITGKAHTSSHSLLWTFECLICLLFSYAAISTGFKSFLTSFPLTFRAAVPSADSLRFRGQPTHVVSRPRS